MRGALRNRLAALETRERRLRPSHPPFVVAVRHNDGSVAACWVATLNRGASRQFHGAEADVEWRRLNGQPSAETIAEACRLRDLLRSDPAAVTAQERRFLAETMERFPAE